MKYELSDDEIESFNQLTDYLNLERTEENEQRLLYYIFFFGISKIMRDCVGFMELKEAFPSLCVIVPEDESEPVESKVQFIGIPLAPDICPGCGKRVIYNGKQWACNCETYLKGPKPEPICPHCHSPVVSFSHYWRCRCNRYSVPPEADALKSNDGSLVNYFPS